MTDLQVADTDKKPVKQLIYAVEDDAALRELYMLSLENEYACKCFEDGESFFNAMENKIPDLVLLDVMLPGDDGFKILARLKSSGAAARVPVLMVSARDGELSKVKGLNLGADDYIAKPFGILELTARIRANLRKGGGMPNEEVKYRDIVIDNVRHCIYANGVQLQATLKEYNLLSMFCDNAGKVLARDAIFTAIWGEGYIGETRTLDMHVKELRKKINAAGCEASIQTVRGVGYMLI